MPSRCRPGSRRPTAGAMAGLGGVAEATGAARVRSAVAAPVRPHAGVAPCPECSGPALYQVEREQVIGACTWC